MDKVKSVHVEVTEGTMRTYDDICVLLLDSDTTCLANMSEMICKRGYHVVAATKAGDLLHIINSKNEKVNLILAEYHLIEMNNYELLQKIKSDCEIPVVVACEYVENTAIAECLKRGAIFYLKKPLMEIFLESLWQFTIRRHIDDKTELDDSKKNKIDDKVSHGSKRKERVDSYRGSDSEYQKNLKLVCMEEEAKHVTDFAAYEYELDERVFLPLKSVRESTSHCAVPLRPQDSSNKEKKKKKSQIALDEEMREDGLSLFDLEFNFQEGQGSTSELEKK